MSDSVTRKRIGGGFKVIGPIGERNLKPQRQDFRRNKKHTDVDRNYADTEHTLSTSSYVESGGEDCYDVTPRHYDHQELKLPHIKKNGQRSLVLDSRSNSVEVDDGYYDTEDSDKRYSDLESHRNDNNEKRNLQSMCSVNIPTPRTHRENDYSVQKDIYVENKKHYSLKKSVKQYKDTKDKRQKDLDESEHQPSIKTLADRKRKERTERREHVLPTEKSDGGYADYPILQYVQDSVVGHDFVIDTPYGQREVVYCDFTASGRSLSFIEDYIRANVMPSYANTHSSTGHNARQTGKYREEARNIIKRCVNASKDDVAIFTGSGTTAGLNKVAWALKLNYPRVAMETAVFIGPYEHHSNILVWRELGTKVVRIRHEPDTGLIDLNQLEEELRFWKEKRRMLLVCMSAASNVTGIVTDVDAVCRIAHQHNALAIFDYAAGGPYLKIDMNPKRGEYKDAVILSPHKFVGGPGTPGLIIAKKWVFKNSVPDRVGGGTVRFVTRETHAYVGNIEEREEGGTPAIIESIRAGMVFKLKEEIGTEVIEKREEELCNRAFAVWEQNPCIYVMGSHTAHRVPIFSFLTVHNETGRLVHHNFISTLLSDLYGIQARGGCACAGPYAEDLMGISESLAKKYMWFLSEKQQWKDKNAPPMPIEVMKPGFTRINLSYFIDDETADFVIQAVNDVTRYGWKLLPKYTFDVQSGSWKHKSFSKTSASDLNSLEQFDISGHYQEPSKRRKKALPLTEVLQNAREVYKHADESRKPRIGSASLELREALPRDKRNLKWFLTPHEAAVILADKEETYLERKRYQLPFKLLNTRPRLESIDTDNGYHSDQDTERRPRERERHVNESTERRQRTRTVGAPSEKVEYSPPRRIRKPKITTKRDMDMYSEGEETSYSPRREKYHGNKPESEQYVTKIMVTKNHRDDH